MVPDWAEGPDPDAFNVVLKPGVAFGAGDHPTTALCLRWMHRNQPALQVWRLRCKPPPPALQRAGLCASALRSANFTRSLIGCSSSLADRLIGSLITSQSTGGAPSRRRSSRRSAA